VLVVSSLCAQRARTVQTVSVVHITQILHSARTMYTACTVHIAHSAHSTHSAHSAHMARWQEQAGDGPCAHSLIWLGCLRNYQMHSLSSQQINVWKEHPWHRLQFEHIRPSAHLPYPPYLPPHISPGPLRHCGLPHESRVVP